MDKPKYSVFSLSVAIAASMIAALTTSVTFATPSQKPVSLTSSAPPAVLLTMGRDHKLYYEAYNDAGDVDGDGTIDTTYKPQSIDYFGLFDSFKCYTYNSASKYFEPSSVSPSKKCSGNWSGDFLNYVTTTRIDAVRRVLYGGMRSTDTATETVLERAYIPQDAHSFGKEWLNGGGAAYNLADYAPGSFVPALNNRVFFANVTLLASHSRTDTAEPPLLRVYLPTDPTRRIWDWLSKERPVAGNSMIGVGSFTPTDLVVRVRVCVPSLLETDCQAYPIGSASPTSYKPTGILHEFGQDDQMRFGLLTGSYDNNNDGGVLRKNISNFAGEVNASDGTFDATANGIVSTINRFRVQGFGGSFAYDCGWNVGDPSTSGQACDDWGNPIAEMMYEGLRYFAGKSGPTAAYVSNGNSKDNALGLTRPAWRDPFKSAANPTGLPYCSKPVQMVISDIYASFDSDKVPGTSFGTFSGDLLGLNAASIGDAISSKEGISGNYFIGQSGSLFDKVPSSKLVTGFGSIRGLAPEEPTRAGSYYSASVAHYGKGTDLRTDLPDSGWAQTVDTYSIALASPLPKIQIPVGDPAAKKFVTLVPFGKSVGGFGISSASTAYQPSNQIVDFYIEQIVNQPGFVTDLSVNDGRPYGRFRINFEDVEQGADHDMDAIAQYTYRVLADGRVEIEVDSSVYAAGSIMQHMGYILNGTTRDGTYLVVRDRDTPVASDITYYLDSKPSDGSWAAQNGLPTLSREIYTPGPTAGARFIPKDPLWYAAKYGGYPDKRVGDAKTIVATGTAGDIQPGGDTRVSGEPDNYYLVTNAGTLRDELRRAFLVIQSRVDTGTAAATGSTAITARTRAFEATFNTEGWTGEVFSDKIARNGGRSFLWKTTDANSFADHTSRKVLTWYNGAPAEFKIGGADGLPPAAAPAFGLSSIYGALESIPALNWTSLTSAQKEQAAMTVLVDYIRGDRSKERSKGGPLRDRQLLLGDIVNSNISYATSLNYGYNALPGIEGSSYAAYVTQKDTNSAFKTIYVGANDGMLHAFDAETGVERFGYVPRSVYNNLRFLTQQGYQHRYYVDGRTEIRDAYRGSAWTTVLLGSTGAGGKSIFALDVGSPGGSTANVLWEFETPDLGYTIGTPAIGRTSGTNGKWVAIFANGYFGAGNKATLFVLDLFTGQELKRFELENTSNANGLGSVALYNVNGVASQIFAGDKLGSLWKIDASKSNPADWIVANGGIAIAKVTDADGKAQPITAQPSVARLEAGSQVFFGTGSLITDSDRADVSVQSMYGIWLNKDPGRTLTRADFHRQVVTSESTNFRVVEPGAAPSGNEWGWYLDLVSPGSGTPTGERVISPVLYSLGYVDFNTWYLGSEDACQPGGQTWHMSLSGETGSVQTPQFDTDGDGRPTKLDKLGGKYAAGLKASQGTIRSPSLGFTAPDREDKGTGVVDQGTGNVTRPPTAAGTCDSCSKMMHGQCRAIPVCAPDSWMQLQ